MRFVHEANEIVFDKQAWMAELDRHLVEATKEGARKWLRTVLIIIPVWSEASHATFNELAEAVGFPISLGNSVSQFGDRRLLGYQTGRGGLDLKGRKQGNFYFFYETDLRYLAWNEYNKAVRGDGSGVWGRLRNPGPYKFQEAGANEFLSFAENVRLPSPMKFIKPKRL
jgi:hypothetical protein